MGGQGRILQQRVQESPCTGAKAEKPRQRVRREDHVADEEQSPAAPCTATADAFRPPNGRPRLCAIAAP